MTLSLLPHVYLKYRKTESLNNAKHDRIENVAFLLETCKDKLPKDKFKKQGQFP
jgi:hypothetical protein